LPLIVKKVVKKLGKLQQQQRSQGTSRDKRKTKDEVILRQKR
jgi:hypothetical protein